MKSTIRCKCGEEIEITDQLDADLRLIADHQAAEIERLEQENRELRHALADVVTNDPIVAAVVSIGEELDLSDDEEDEYEHDEDDEYAEWSTDQ